MMKGKKKMKRLSKEEAKELMMKRHIDDIDYILSKGIYAVTDSGDIISFEKPSIHRDMYYDDETPRPETDFDSWKQYNKFYSRFYRLQEWKSDIESYKLFGCCSGRLLTSPAYKRYPGYTSEVELYRSGWEYSDDGYIFLNEKETAEYLKIMEDLEKEYDKRLETYYKKYSNKIYSVGYWANR